MASNILHCSCGANVNNFGEERFAELAGAPNDGFFLNALKTLVRVSRNASVRSSQGNLRLFGIARASVLFSRKF